MSKSQEKRIAVQREQPTSNPIVERLWEYGTVVGKPLSAQDRVCHDAANEIERLEKRVAELERNLELEAGVRASVANALYAEIEDRDKRGAAVPPSNMLCEMEGADESHDLSAGVVCIACWNKVARRAEPPAEHPKPLQAVVDMWQDRANEHRRLLREGAGAINGTEADMIERVLQDVRRASVPPFDAREERLREAFLQCRQMLATRTGTFYNAAHFGLVPEDIGMERVSETKSGRCTCEHGVPNDRGCEVHGAQLRAEDETSACLDPQSEKKQPGCKCPDCDS